MGYSLSQHGLSTSVLRDERGKRLVPGTQRTIEALMFRIHQLIICIECLAMTAPFLLFCSSAFRTPHFSMFLWSCAPVNQIGLCVPTPAPCHVTLPVLLHSRFWCRWPHSVWDRRRNLSYSGWVYKSFWFGICTCPNTAITTTHRHWYWSLLFLWFYVQAFRGKTLMSGCGRSFRTWFCTCSIDFIVEEKKRAEIEVYTINM